MSSTGMVTHMLSRSRFNRRLHQIRDLIVDLIFQLSTLIKELNIGSEYSIDSCPVHTGDNICIIRTKLVQGAVYRDNKVSMRRYFYGYNIHLLCNADEIPVEHTFLLGSKHDTSALKQMPLQLPPGSKIYADNAYTNYSIEDMLKDAENIDLLVARRFGSKKKHESYIDYLKSSMRKRIETTFIEISNSLPKKIHAVTEAGFEGCDIHLYLYDFKNCNINSNLSYLVNPVKPTVFHSHNSDVVGQSFSFPCPDPSCQQWS